VRVARREALSSLRHQLPVVFRPDGTEVPSARRPQEASSQVPRWEAARPEVRLLAAVSRARSLRVGCRRARLPAFPVAACPSDACQSAQALRRAKSSVQASSLPPEAAVARE
jgi:hypothetical protein